MIKKLLLISSLFLSSAFANAENVICGKKVFCSEMNNCEEAMAYLKKCPSQVKIDGDDDGIPCEKQHCGHLKKWKFFK